MRLRILIACVAALATACQSDITVKLQVRITGDDRKTPMRNPGSPSTPASDVDVLKLTVFNTSAGVSREANLTNDFTISDKIQAGALDVTAGPGWQAEIIGDDRNGALWSMGRSKVFDVPKSGSVAVPVVFGIADDFATTATISGGIGPFATASALPDGSVLLVGLAGARMHTPITGAVCDTCLTGDVPSPRFMHTATTLADGKVFIAGGANAMGHPLNDCFVFDPAAHSFTKVNAGGFSGRIGAAAALLGGGKVLLAGGKGANPGDGAVVQVVDTAGGNVTMAPALPQAVMLAAATTLTTGEVLVTGGLDESGAPVSSSSVYSADGATVKAGPAMLTARGAHTATLLSDGYVFLFGGRGMGGGSLATAEVFTPTSQFIGVDSSNLDPRAGHAAVKLDTGAVLIIGGQDDLTGPPDPARLVPALSFTPQNEVNGKYAGTFVPLGQVVSRVGATAAVLPDLSVIAAGGARPTLAADPSVAAASTDWVESIELFVPCATNTRACPR